MSMIIDPIGVPWNVTFAAATMDASAIPGGTVFAVDVEQRVIRGTAVPYGVVGLKAGQRFQFSRGTVHAREGMKVKLWALHDQVHAAGVVTEWNDTDAGLEVAFAVARTPEGDRALAQADSGVWDGLSIGPSEGAKYVLRDGVYHSVDIPIHEISLTPAPVFGGARVSSVAFDTITEENTSMLNDEQKARLKELALSTSRTSEEDAELTTLLDVLTGGDPAVTEALSAAIAQGAVNFSSLDNLFEVIGSLASTRTTVPAGAPRAHVEEAPRYRFDGVAGEHDFSTDLIAYGRDHDGEAGERIMGFMADQFGPSFDVDTGNVTTLNPARNRPDLYVDERRFTTPLYDALHKGAITDSTPFVVPRFNSAAGLVADHVEGVEPTPGSFTATSQTITPSAVSGKVEITREVWDQGGNPQVSGLLWAKIVQHYFTALEGKAYALLNALTLPGGQITTVTTAAADDDLVNEVEAVIVDLNFVAGGNTFDYAATHANLYKKLAAAVDAAGRKLLPQYGPTNANGQSRTKFASLDVAGTEFSPVPTLGAPSTATGKSYLLDSTAVHVWNSVPQRLEFQYRVAYIDLAVFGYVATAVTDLAGVRRLDYDPTV